jgi:hypothetical protein
MRRISSFLLTAGALVGAGAVGSAAPAHAGGCCAPAVVVYYAPPACCPRYYGGHYYKTSQYWPAVRPHWMERPYWPVRPRRR